MVCDAEQREVAMRVADHAAELLKLKSEMAAEKVSPSTVIKVVTSWMKVTKAMDAYDQCLQSNTLTAQSGALQGAIDRIQPEIERLKTSLEGAGYSGVTEDGAPYSGQTQ